MALARCIPKESSPYADELYISSTYAFTWSMPDLVTVELKRDVLSFQAPAYEKNYKLIGMEIKTYILLHNCRSL